MFRYELLVLEHFVVRDDVGVRPVVQSAACRTTIGRNSSVSTGSTREAAPIGRREHDAPGAAGELVDHAEREAAERDAEARTCSRSGTTGRTASGCSEPCRQRRRARPPHPPREAAAGTRPSSGISSPAGLLERH